MVTTARPEAIPRDRPMPVFAHIRELRDRVRWVAIALVPGFVAAFVFYQPILDILLRPARGLLSPTGLPVVTSPTEFMGLTLQISFATGLVLGLPVAVYQAVMFAAPAVSAGTRRLMLLLFPAALLLFAGGVTLGYFLVLPTMMKFLVTFGSDLATPMIRISEYYSLTVMLLAGLGLAFETPLVMYALAKIGIVNYKGFLKFRKFMIVIAFIVGAIFDPSPNPLDQIIVAGIIILLYHVGILLARTVYKGKEKAAALTSEKST